MIFQNPMASWSRGSRRLWGKPLLFHCSLYFFYRLQERCLATSFGEQDIIDNETELILVQTGKQCYLFFLYDTFFFLSVDPFLTSPVCLLNICSGHRGAYGIDWRSLNPIWPDGKCPHWFQPSRTTLLFYPILHGLFWAGWSRGGGGGMESTTSLWL